jgi:hypothetical protein
MTDTTEAPEAAAVAPAPAPSTPAAPRPLYELLADAMIAVDAVGKNGYNKHGNYAFRGIDDVINAVGPVLRQLRIVPIPKLQHVEYRDVLTSTGKPAKETTLRVVYRFRGPAGDYEDVEVPGESMDFADKGTAQAMSVAYRIALLQLLCIPTNEPDPDSFQPERGAPAREPRRRPRPKGASADAEPAPAPFQPSEEAQELMASVNAAAHQGAAKRVWKRIVDGFKSGAVTEAEANWLRKRFEERGPELPPDPDAPQAAAETESQDTPAALEGELIETGATE